MGIGRPRFTSTSTHSVSDSKIVLPSEIRSNLHLRTQESLPYAATQVFPRISSPRKAWFLYSTCCTRTIQAPPSSRISAVPPAESECSIAMSWIHCTGQTLFRCRLRSIISGSTRNVFSWTTGFWFSSAADMASPFRRGSFRAALFQIVLLQLHQELQRLHRRHPLGVGLAQLLERELFAFGELGIAE